MNWINSISVFVKKYKLVIIAAVLLYISFAYLNIKEGLVNATSCTQFANCIECVNGKVIDTSSPCYWNSEKKKCGSFDDEGYSRQCYPDTGPSPSPLPSPSPIDDTEIEPGPGPGSGPVSGHCPELTLLKNPTFITKQ